MDMGIFARIWATHLMWYQGYSERARVRAEETMRAATELGHPFTVTVTLAYAAMLCQFMRDVDGTDRLATATTAQATEHGFPYYRAWAEVLFGWSRVALGRSPAHNARPRSNCGRRWALRSCHTARGRPDKRSAN
jgi:hypothetical protein